MIDSIFASATTTRSWWCSCFSTVLVLVGHPADGSELRAGRSADPVRMSTRRRRRSWIRRSRSRQRVSYWLASCGPQLSPRTAVAMASGCAAVGVFFVLWRSTLRSCRSTSPSSGATQRMGIRFPSSRALFNRLLFENAVDVFFNLLLVAVSRSTLDRLLGCARRSGARASGPVRLARWLRGVHAVASRWWLFPCPGQTLGAGRTTPVHRYGARRRLDRGARDGSRAAGARHVPLAVFPLRRFHYRDTDPTRSVLPPSAAHWVGTDSEGVATCSRACSTARACRSRSASWRSRSTWLIGVVLGATGRLLRRLGRRPWFSRAHRGDDLLSELLPDLSRSRPSWRSARSST